MRMIYLFTLTLVCCGLVACSSRGLNMQGAKVRADCGIQSRCFTSIQAAIDSAPEKNLRPFRITIAKGIYHEKLRIVKDNIQLIGHSAADTKIIFGDYAAKRDANGNAITTFGSATLSIDAKDIKLKNLSIENSFDFVANDKLANDAPQKIAGTQAVALSVAGQSDRVLVQQVGLRGNQDTLFVNAGRSWFDHVTISGNVDFIFGAGNALFTRSEIKTIARGRTTTPYGYITAASTSLNQFYGFTFIECKLTRDEAVPNYSTALGRPWHPTTTFADGRYADPNAQGKVVFIHTSMDEHIMPDGWVSMSGTTKSGDKKPFFPEDARFYEFDSQGLGAQKKSSARKQISAVDTLQYVPEKILGDWKVN